jgi:hypothetical protein
MYKKTIKSFVATHVLLHLAAVSIIERIPANLSAPFPSLLRET